MSADDEGVPLDELQRAHAMIKALPLAQKLRLAAELMDAGRHGLAEAVLAYALVVPPTAIRDDGRRARLGELLGQLVDALGPVGRFVEAPVRTLQGHLDEGAHDRAREALDRAGKLLEQLAEEFER